LTCIRCLDVGLLSPSASASCEYIDGASLRDRLVLLVAVDARGVARLPERRHDHRVAVGTQGDGMAELRARPWIRGLDVGLLFPVAAVAHEDIDGASVEDRVVARVTLDAWRTPGLVRRSDCQCGAVVADGDALTRVTLEHTTASEVIGGVGVRRLQIDRLCDQSG